MHTIIHPLAPARRSRSKAAAPALYRRPHYDAVEAGECLMLSVYVPGVDASGVEITTQGPDLMVTARKAHVVRVNWTALHLEPAQRDYRLRLRLGHGLDFEGLQAELHDGVLTVRLPKRQRPVIGTQLRIPQSA